MRMKFLWKEHLKNRCCRSRIEWEINKSSSLTFGCFPQSFQGWLQEIFPLRKSRNIFISSLCSAYSQKKFKLWVSFYWLYWWKRKNKYLKYHYKIYNIWYVWGFVDTFNRFRYWWIRCTIQEFDDFKTQNRLFGSNEGSTSVTTKTRQSVIKI